MTAINKDGQVYWTFEDLDLETVLIDVEEELTLLIDKRKECQKQEPTPYRNALWLSYTKRINVLQDIAGYLTYLVVGKPFTNWTLISGGNQK